MKNPGARGAETAAAMRWSDADFERLSRVPAAAVDGPFAERDVDPGNLDGDIARISRTANPTAAPPASGTSSPPSRSPSSQSPRPASMAGGTGARPSSTAFGRLWVRRRYRAVRVTGATYGGDVIADPAERAPERFLRKPFRDYELAQAVRDAVAERGPAAAE